MREAAADLDFETAARLRDEIKRLRETELAIADDPLAREVEIEAGSSARKGRSGRSPSGRPAAADRSAPQRSEPQSGDSVSENNSSLFAKPDLDEMGTSGDHAVAAGTVDRSLFRKQSAREAHGSDYGMPNDAPNLFRKNTLDEMTVRRTEKPVEGARPVKPVEDVKPVVRGKVGAGSYEDPADERRNKRKPGKTGRPGR